MNTQTATAKLDDTAVWLEPARLNSSCWVVRSRRHPHLDRARGLVEWATMTSSDQLRLGRIRLMSQTDDEFLAWCQQVEERVIADPDSIERIIDGWSDLPPPHDGTGATDPDTFDELTPAEFKQRVEMNRARRTDT